MCKECKEKCNPNKNSLVLTCQGQAFGLGWRLDYCMKIVGPMVFMLP